MLQKALGCLFVFGIAPVGIGGLWTKGIGQKREKILNLYLAGFLSELAVFQLIAVPVMVKEVYGMNLLVYLTTAVFAVLAATGFIWTLLRERDLRKQTGRNEDVNQQQAGQAQACSLRKSMISGTGNGARNRIRRTAVQNPERLLFWLLFLASVGYQMYMAFAYASFDGDDAYYVVQSVLADQTGVLNRIRPYTGLSTDLDIRHALATLPLWIAYMARMTGIHATIVAHTLLPLIFIPLTYYVFVQIGRKLFSDGSVKLPIFLTLVSIMQIWGNISIYTNETFFLTRTWQGKSVLANLILLVELWLMLELCAREKNRERQEETGSQLPYWLLLAVNHIAAAMMTSMGAFLTALLFGITALVAAIRYRSWSILWKTALCCIPNVVYLALLLVL